MEMNGLDKLSYLLVVIGGLNWGLVGFFNYNLVEKLVSTNVANIVYDIVGLAALYMFVKMVMMMGNMKPAKK
jgi:hypothetical protein